MHLTELNKENTWQIGTGDGSRGYVGLFFKHGVAVVGPGDPGEEGTEVAKRYYTDNGTITNWGGVLNQVKVDHWLIARPGTGRIAAVGRVTGPMRYGRFFEDVEGWDLQHYVPVEWYQPATEDKILHLKRNCLTRATIQDCYLEEVFEAIRNTPFVRMEPEHSVDTLQSPEEESIEAVADALVDKGVRVQDAENVMRTIQRIVRLTHWYYDNDRAVLEHEIRAFLVLPLLQALGWSEQCMKLEYGRSDVALFGRPFRAEDKPSPEVILEAKTFGNGLAYTQGQALTYGATFKECMRFVTTNGFRYRTYERRGEELVPTGYVNLLRLRKSNVLEPELMKPIDTLVSLSNLV
jgi:hypothetical protein